MTCGSACTSLSQAGASPPQSAAALRLLCAETRQGLAPSTPQQPPSHGGFLPARFRLRGHRRTHDQSQSIPHMIHTNAVGHTNYHHIVYLKYMRPCSMRAVYALHRGKEIAPMQYARSALHRGNPKEMREGGVTSARAATACYPRRCEDGQLQ